MIVMLALLLLQGLSSLLAAGPLAALAALAAAPEPQVPPWMRQPAQSAALPQLQLLQQTGLVGGRRSTSSNRLPLKYVADSFQHHATFRGHGFSVFALTFDKNGRRVVTGADDAIIKVKSSSCHSAVIPQQQIAISAAVMAMHSKKHLSYQPQPSAAVFKCPALYSCRCSSSSSPTLPCTCVLAESYATALKLYHQVQGCVCDNVLACRSGALRPVCCLSRGEVTLVRSLTCPCQLMAAWLPQRL